MGILDRHKNYRGDGAFQHIDLRPGMALVMLEADPVLWFARFFMPVEVPRVRFVLGLWCS